MLNVNADDWGWTAQVTDRTRSCYQEKRIHTVSAMMFMHDSERAAELALQMGLEAGLHLNLIQQFGSSSAGEPLRAHQGMVAAFLSARKLHQLLWNPFLSASLRYTVEAQCAEFQRLYGAAPARIDGHHHMHLCMNMLLSGLLPRGSRVRRNFSFRPGEKGPFNRLYRFLVDKWLTSRCSSSDFFFSLQPIRKERLAGIVSLSRRAEVELMVHAGVEEEYLYLRGAEWAGLLAETEGRSHG